LPYFAAERPDEWVAAALGGIKAVQRDAPAAEVVEE
jgi:hypothetical protein